jgi:hypothetical protein
MRRRQIYAAQAEKERAALAAQQIAPVVLPDVGASEPAVAPTESPPPVSTPKREKLRLKEKRHG